MSILNHSCVGTNNKIASEAFYTASLGELGVKNMGKMGNGATMYGVQAPEFLVFSETRDGQAASVGNGSTTGFKAASRAQVNAFHAAGMANGGTCQGEPGPRAVSPTAYGAYLKDPDGNKICAFCFADE